MDEITLEDKVKFYDKLNEAVKKDDPTYLTLTRSRDGALKFEKTAEVRFPASQLDPRARAKAAELGGNAVVRIRLDARGQWEILD